MNTTAAPELEDEPKSFVCNNCKFKAAYDYYGSKPPFQKSLLLLEESYVMKDPFTSDRGFIMLGSHCSLCKSNVCLSQECSIFYTKRFCIQCVGSYIDEFPQEIQEEIKRRKK